MNLSITCRLCNTSYETVSPLFIQKPYSIYACPSCTFASLHPLPDTRTLQEIYANPRYHADKTPTEHVLDANKRAHYIANYLKPSDKLLDYGAGNGSFMRAINQHIMNIEGYDAYLNNESVRNKSLIKTGKSDQNTYAKESFDAITCFDVIEHIADFMNTLEYFNQWLKNDGYLFITTPSLDRWDARLLRSNWYGFSKIPQHLNYFNNRSITTALNQVGFTTIDIIPWGFVRSATFIMSKLFPQFTVPSVFNRLNLHISAINMMIIARPKK